MLDQPEILFEDQDLLIVNKPSGFVTEGGNSAESDLELWSTAKTQKNVRCCHRLDRQTSGVVILRKNNRFNRELAKVFETHQIRKSYWAITQGAWPAQVTKLENLLGPARNGNYQVVQSQGKMAKTSVRVLGKSINPNHSWLQLLLKTGRTHQARVQCAHVGCPILGDIRYGSAASKGIFGLHAREIRFSHPGSREPLVLTANAPPAWNAYIKMISPDSINSLNTT